MQNGLTRIFHYSTLITTARHLMLTSARWIQSTCSRPICFTHTHTHTHTHFSIIIPSLPRPLKRSLSLRFPHQIPLCITFYPMRDAFSTHLILLGLSTWSIWLSKFMKFLITHFSRAFCYILPLGPNISLSTFYSNICPLLNVRDQVSRGKIIAVYNSYLEDQIFWT